MEYYVINKKGEQVELDFNRVLFRLQELKNIKPKLNVNVPLIAQNTIKMMVNGISTKELDEISIKFCASMITTDIDYDTMAVRLTVDNLHRETSDCYLKTCLDINNYFIDNEKIEILHVKLIKFVNNYYKVINENLNYSMDYKYTYFGIKTLMKSYLIKHLQGAKNMVKERPQHMLMRVSIGLNINNIDEEGIANLETINSIIDTYKLMSNKYYTHATPTLFNSGTHRQAMSSCFLLSVDDSLTDIYKTLTDTAMISKWSGGIGIHVSQVRALNSIIKSTNGKSEGIVPMLKMYNDSAVYVSQGGGKRKGSTAVYLETWHADILDFLDLKKPVGDESRRARDLFLALWVCDLFMERLVNAISTGQEIMWSLFCPSKAVGLTDTYGEEYKKLYIKYENDKIWNKQISITKLWKHILEVQMESGVPYIMYKDHVNRKTNQNNLGTIKSSNLCVSGDTMILTDEGYKKIKTMENKEVNVWNGKQFSKTTVVKTGENQKLLELTFSNGAILKCTNYHKFFITEKNKEVKLNANQLKEGDVLINSNYPSIDIRKEGKQYWKPYYTSGYYAGIGVNGEVVAYHSKRILDYILKYKDCYFDNCGNKRYVMYDEVKSEKIPICEDMISKIEWLTGFIDACGVISSNKQVFTIHLIHKSKDLLNEVRLLCNTMGMSPYLSKNKDKLLFSTYDTVYMHKNLNVSPYIICYNGKFTDFVYKRENKRKEDYIYLEAKKELEGRFDTYCFNEPLEHKGMFNGIIAGNCSEILIYTDKENTGVCNLASICLSKFVDKRINGYGMIEPYYNYDKLHEVCKKAVYNLNKVIDNNVYPVKEGQKADNENRPIGLGVQSLAKVFFKMNIPFVCEKSKEINKKIFETMYHASLTASCELAKKYGTYANYHTSMVAKGILQHDLWNEEETELWDWDELRNNIKIHGIRNSLLIALMPTASTAQIMGNTESFEPISSNIYVRNTLSGTFQVVNKYLLRDLKKINMWNDEMKQRIIALDGSIQNIEGIPVSIKKKYMTVWEIKQKDLIDMEATRNAFVCQSTSSNRYLKNPDNAKLTSMHIYCWKKGLKTGMYYLRSQSAVSAVKFNVDTNILMESKENKIEDEEECIMCSA